MGGEAGVGVNGVVVIGSYWEERMELVLMGGCYWVLVGGEAGVGVNGGLLLGLSGRRGWSWC